MDIFYKYIQILAALITERPLLIIFDGHLSHLDNRTLKKARTEGIVILKLPAHTTDTLQPLDKTCFKSLKLLWDDIILDFQLKNQRKMTKIEFSEAMAKLIREMKVENILSGFSSTGIYPVDRTKYPIKRLNALKLKWYHELKAAQESAGPKTSSDSTSALPTTSSDNTNIENMLSAPSVQPCSSLSILIPTAPCTPLVTPASITPTSSGGSTASGMSFEEALLS